MCNNFVKSHMTEFSGVAIDNVLPYGYETTKHPGFILPFPVYSTKSTFK